MMAKVAFLALLLSVTFAFNVDIQAEGGASLRVSITNTKSEPLTMLLWNTPFDDMSQLFRGDIFNVAHSTLGVVAEYSGIVLKRVLTLQDFVTLNPGQTISTVLDLNNGYNFPVAGEYKVTLNTFARIVRDNDVTVLNSEFLRSLDVTPLHSGSVVVQIDQASPPLVFELPVNVSTGTPSYKSCSSTDQSRASTANSNAGTMLSGAISNINKGCTAAYQTWFGACNSGRQSTVSTTLSKTASLRANSPYVIDCSQSGCPANTYAYVYPSDTTSHTVHLCSAWWSAPTGTCRYDSAAGTLIHELTHFNDVGATKDYAYGQTACKNLAQSNPSNAVYNADSYEYFNESCP